MPKALVAIGNPGAGKSTMLNIIAQMILFVSGNSIGPGLTYQLEEKTDAFGNLYIDTPGISDNMHRKKAGKDISRKLKKGGCYKILFFVRQTHGRVVTEDITTMKLVLDAAPEIGNRFGIIINQVNSEVIEQLQTDDDSISKFLLCLFYGIDAKFHHRNVLFLPTKPDLNGKKNQLLPLSQFPDLEPFLEYSVPEVSLTKNKASEIATQSFEEMSEMITKFRNQMEGDKVAYQRQVETMNTEIQRLKRENEEKKLFGILLPCVTQLASSFVTGGISNVGSLYRAAVSAASAASAAAAQNSVAEKKQL